MIMMSLKQIHFPSRVCYFLNKAYRIQSINEGKSGSYVYKLYYYNSPNLYLKYDVKKRSYDKISDEVHVLRWLHGKLKVPEILVYEELGQMEFLITKEIPGYLLSSLISTESKTNIIKLYAEIINEIHSIRINNCPFDQTFHIKMHKAKLRVQQNEISSSSFDSINQRFTPEELYKYLQKNEPVLDNLVFTHGDLYMNNVLISDHQLSGIVDWARGGYCDYHYDVCIILHNIDKYIGKEYKELFLGYYKNQVNEDLIDYYWKLNEFF